MKPLLSSLLQTHPPRHHLQRTRCQGPVQYLQSWMSCSTKVSIWPTKTREGFLGNSTVRPGYQHQETTTQDDLKHRKEKPKEEKVGKNFEIQVQGAWRFSNWNLPCILFSKTLLQLPGSQLLFWLFQVRLHHQTELMLQMREHSYSWRQSTKETVPRGESYIESKILTQTLTFHVMMFGWYLHKCSRLIPDPLTNMKSLVFPNSRNTPKWLYNNCTKYASINLTKYSSIINPTKYPFINPTNMLVYQSYTNHIYNYIFSSVLFYGCNTNTLYLVFR